MHQDRKEKNNNFADCYSSDKKLEYGAYSLQNKVGESQQEKVNIGKIYAPDSNPHYES